MNKNGPTRINSMSVFERLSSPNYVTASQRARLQQEKEHRERRKNRGQETFNGRIHSRRRVTEDRDGGYTSTTSINNGAKKKSSAEFFCQSPSKKKNGSHAKMETRRSISTPRSFLRENNNGDDAISPIAKTSPTIRERRKNSGTSNVFDRLANTGTLSSTRREKGIRDDSCSRSIGSKASLGSKVSLGSKAKRRELSSSPKIIDDKKSRSVPPVFHRLTSNTSTQSISKDKKSGSVAATRRKRIINKDDREKRGKVNIKNTYGQQQQNTTTTRSLSPSVMICGSPVRRNHRERKGMGGITNNTSNCQRKKAGKSLPPPKSLINSETSSRKRNNNRNIPPKSPGSRVFSKSPVVADMYDFDQDSEFSMDSSDDEQNVEIGAGIESSTSLQNISGISVDDNQTEIRNEDAEVAMNNAAREIETVTKLKAEEKARAIEEESDMIKTEELANTVEEETKTVEEEAKTVEEEAARVTAEEEEKGKTIAQKSTRVKAEEKNMATENEVARIKAEEDAKVEAVRIEAEEAAVEEAVRVQAEEEAKVIEAEAQAAEEEASRIKAEEAIIEASMIKAETLLKLL